jgi:hydroxymethylpyrimidine/phosphomethylpyrimidine kinase
VLVKGGHLKDSLSAIDIFFDGVEEVTLTAPFISQVNTHGTGCTYSAAITALLARGATLREAVEQAKEYITQAIAQSVRVGEFDVLNSFWGGRI